MMHSHAASPTQESSGKVYFPARYFVHKEISGENNYLCSPSRFQSNNLILRRIYITLLLWGWIGFVLAGQSIENLRISQQNELDTLRQTYDAKVRSHPELINPDGSVNSGHPEYARILSEYSKEKVEIQKKYSRQDPRSAEINELEKKYGKGTVTTTGSAPKDVRADVDLTATSKGAADKLAADWKANGDDVHYDPTLGIYINKTRDTTLWPPPSQAQAQARQSYHDSFSTPGGKKATGVKGGEAISDPEGFVLDNEKKFIHAAGELIQKPDPTGGQAQLERDMALKTAGKSVSKAAESVGQQSDVVKQAQNLRNYQDEFESGITVLGATREQQKQDVQDWLGKADQQIQGSKGEAEKRSQQIQETREQLAATTQGKGGGSDTAEAIRARNEKILSENAKAKIANDEARKTAGIGPTPDRGGTTTSNSTKQASSEPIKSTTTQEGKSANTTWKITKEQEGDTSRVTTHTTMTDETGSLTTTEKVSTTERPSGNGKFENETTKISETKADGSSTVTTQKAGKYTGPDGVTTQSTSSTTTTDSVGRSTNSQTEIISETDRAGGKTTRTITMTDGPYAKSASSELSYEKKIRDGTQGDDEERTTDSSKIEKSVKLAGSDLFETKNQAKNTESVSNATMVKGAEISGEGKIEDRQAGAKGSWDASITKDGVKGKTEVSGELNVLKASATGAAEKKITDDVSIGSKVTATVKAGGELKAASEAEIGPEKIAGSAEANVFVGGKAEVEAEVSLSALGIKLTGKGQAEVSYGVGGQAKVKAELSWTKIKMNGKLAGTLGLGTGGSANVEVDASKAITGVDLEAVERDQNAANGIISVVRDIRSGNLQLPPGQTFADIRRTLQEKADWYAKYPQKDSNGKVIPLEKTLADEITKNQGKVSNNIADKGGTPPPQSETRQNRPNMNANAVDSQKSKQEDDQKRTDAAIADKQQAMIDKKLADAEKAKQATDQKRTDAAIADKQQAMIDKKLADAEKAKQAADQKRTEVAVAEKQQVMGEKKAAKDNKDKIQKDKLQQQKLEKERIAQEKKEKDRIAKEKPIKSIPEQQAIAQNTRKEVQVCSIVVPNGGYSVDAGFAANKNGKTKITYVKDKSGKDVGTVYTHYDKKGILSGTNCYINKEEKPVVAEGKSFNGKYAGTITGEAGGSISFSINNGSLNGRFSGSYEKEGVSGNVTGNVSSFGTITARVSGHFTDGEPFNGTLTGMVGGNVASGTWQTKAFGTAAGMWSTTRRQ